MSASVSVNRAEVRLRPRTGRLSPVDLTISQEGAPSVDIASAPPGLDPFPQRFELGERAKELGPREFRSLGGQREVVPNSSSSFGGGLARDRRFPRCLPGNRIPRPRSRRR